MMISNVLTPCCTQHTSFINCKTSASIDSEAKLLIGFSISSHTITVLKKVFLHNSFFLLKYVKFSIARLLLYGLEAC